MAKKDETHISTTPEIKEKLKAIAGRESRSMRTVLSRIITDAFEKTFGGK